MTIGKRIKESRERIGLSQTELAERVKIGKQLLYKYENGIITNIPSDKIEKIANICSTTPQYLMGWEDNTISFSPEATQIAIAYDQADDVDKAMVERILRIDFKKENARLESSGLKRSFDESERKAI